MAENFYDIEGNPLVAYEQSMSPGQAVVFVIQADCRTGKFLRCQPVENVTVEGRFFNVGAFVNLETAGLSVGAFDGVRKTFEIRATADANAEYSIENAVFQIKS